MKSANVKGRTLLLVRYDRAAPGVKAEVEVLNDVDQAVLLDDRQPGAPPVNGELLPLVRGAS